MSDILGWRVWALLAATSALCACTGRGCERSGADRDESTDDSRAEAAVTVKQPERFELGSPSFSALVRKTYPTTDVRIEVAIKPRQPGVVLDTVGINAAKPGSWALSVGADDRVVLQIYDPAGSSTVKASNGWHMLVTRGRAARGASSLAVIELWRGEVALWLNGTLEARVALPTPLSGDPVYVGDFPGDDSWGPKYNIHSAMIGTVQLAYFGVLEPKAYVRDRELEVQ